MIGRWTYRYEPVEVDGNRVEVRGLNYGERLEFAAAQREARAKGANMELPGKLAKWGVKDLSDDALATMPPELLEAACDKILELSKLKAPEPAAPEPPVPEPPEGAGGKKE